MNKINWLENSKTSLIILVILITILLIVASLTSLSLILVIAMTFLPVAGLAIYLKSKNPLNKIAGFALFGISLMALLILLFLIRTQPPM